MIQSIPFDKLQLMAARERNNEGFQELKSQLLGFIVNRVPDREEAEDLLHDVYLQMAQTVEPIEQLRAWLYRVTRNKITDRFRKKRAHAFSKLGDDERRIEETTRSSLSTPDTEMMDNLVWDAFQTALGELPPEQREAFELHEMEGMSFQQMSEALNQPVNTLISRKHYAVKALRKRLKSIYAEMNEG